MLFSFFDLIKDEIDAPRDDAHILLRLGAALHGVSFAASGLPVGENAYILTVDGALD